MTDIDSKRSLTFTFPPFSYGFSVFCLHTLKRFGAICKSALIDCPDRPMRGSKSFLEALLLTRVGTIPLCGALRPMGCISMEDRALTWAQTAAPSVGNLKSSH